MNSEETNLISGCSLRNQVRSRYQVPGIRYQKERKPSAVRPFVASEPVSDVKETHRPFVASENRDRGAEEQGRGDHSS